MSMEDVPKNNVVEVRSLIRMSEVCLKDRVRINVRREQCGLKEDVVTKIKKEMLRWFGNLERIYKMKLKSQGASEIYNALMKYMT